MQEVFARLELHRLKLHPKNCRYYHYKVEDLDHMIRIRCDEVVVMVFMQRSYFVSQLRAILELEDYYKKFVKTISVIVKALIMLTRNEQPSMWEKEQRKAFIELKERLASTPILQRPIVVWAYQLYTNWSGLDIGAILTQTSDKSK
jgi:hypothetical protein